MSKKTFPLNKNQLEQLTQQYPTPFYLYDEKAICDNFAKFKEAFSIFPEFREYFAVKALPNPYILKILSKLGCGADCSSLPELILAEKAGMKDEFVMFTSNETTEKEYIYANLKNNIINLDDISHIDFLQNALGALPELICFRYNPGSLKQGGVNAIIGKPEEAKYGLTRDQIFEAYAECKKRGVKRFGLHTMVASNELNPDSFVETARILFELATELKQKLDISLEFIDMGGGLGIPYKLNQKAVDYYQLAKAMKVEYDKYIVATGLDPLRICWECGRPITGPYGYLVTRAIHEKHIYRDYIGVDASMADLMRPGMYGAYHHLTVAGKDDVVDENGDLLKNVESHVYDVVGSLCENCDKFAVQRNLPKIDIGDLLIIHDAGAHGRAMGFNYNAKLRCGELLLRTDGSVKQIRRSETIDDYFATIDFAQLGNFQ